jgi:hypothetical protein
MKRMSALNAARGDKDKHQHQKLKMENDPAKISAYGSVRN